MDEKERPRPPLPTDYTVEITAFSRQYFILRALFCDYNEEAPILSIEQIREKTGSNLDHAVNIHNVLDRLDKHGYTYMTYGPAKSGKTGMKRHHKITEKGRDQFLKCLQELYDEVEILQNLEFGDPI